MTSEWMIKLKHLWIWNLQRWYYKYLCIRAAASCWSRGVLRLRSACFISNSIFRLSFKLLRAFGSFSLKVAYKLLSFIMYFGPFWPKIGYYKGNDRFPGNLSLGSCLAVAYFLAYFQLIKKNVYLRWKCVHNPGNGHRRFPSAGRYMIC